MVNVGRSCWAGAAAAGTANTSAIRMPTTPIRAAMMVRIGRTRLPFFEREGMILRGTTGKK
jgi:hypothetical protein